MTNMRTYMKTKRLALLAAAKQTRGEGNFSLSKIIICKKASKFSKFVQAKSGQYKNNLGIAERRGRCTA